MFVSFCIIIEKIIILRCYLIISIVIILFYEVIYAQNFFIQLAELYSEIVVVFFAIDVPDYSIIQNFFVNSKGAPILCTKKNKKNNMMS